ncbi:hypothetical protein ACFFSY_10335 [Paenibacillus aurantiacus]|uniref:Uncharacterized protein n=1 Tax=Paenibacillus aurantiacus TaxID=1936118 RepID=A0ABV5KM43_9BACL
MKPLAVLKQSKVKYLLLLPSSVITFIVLSFSYLAIFGFEYQHRFREEYIGPSQTSKLIGVAIVVGYLALTYTFAWFYNRDRSRTISRLVWSVFNTFIVVAVGMAASLPVLLLASFSLMD